MALLLTFTASKLLESSLIGSDGVIHYSIKTTRGLRGRKVTTATSSTGSRVVGSINWRERTFTIEGVQQAWSSQPQECTWGEEFAFVLRYRNALTELVATRATKVNPDSEDTSSIPGIKFTRAGAKSNPPATITFPSQISDERERMVALLAILRMETMRQDQGARAESNASSTAAVMHVLGGIVDGRGVPITLPIDGVVGQK
ncbi:hypothetical protein C8F01DRAFT_1158487 [Mycena amicta]|nr:hypothetical protein C8F01DRAFT_1158487 [Mycena amicta]